jgi:hypothetical protein
MGLLQHAGQSVSLARATDFQLKGILQLTADTALREYTYQVNCVGQKSG